MFQTARPATAPDLHASLTARCPQCGTPVSGIGATGPGGHEFADCGHDASAQAVQSMTGR